MNTSLTYRLLLEPELELLERELPLLLPEDELRTELPELLRLREELPDR